MPKIKEEDEQDPGFKIYQCRTKYLVQNRDGAYVELTKGMLKNRLIQRKFLGDINGLLEYVSEHNQVEIYTRLAGCAPGFQWNNGFRVLVTDAPKLVEPKEGDWEISRQLFERQMGEQLDYFYTWWQTARRRVREHKFVPLQSIVFVGPPLGGKTTNLWLIGKSLGRTANPFDYMAGRTPFNEHIAGAELLLLDDEHTYLDHKMRKQVAEYMKWIPTRPNHNVHPKGQTARELNIITVLAIAVNSGSEDVKIIPAPHESDMKNRAHIFKVETAPMPMPVRTVEEKLAFRETLLSERAAVYYFLDCQYRMPPEIADPANRFPCKAWQHPDVVATVSGNSAVMQFRNIVLAVLTKRDSLSSAELLGVLAGGDLRQTAYNLARDTQSAGNLLGQWKRLFPKEFGPGKTCDGIHYWDIIPPTEAQEWRDAEAEAKRKQRKTQEEQG